MKNVIDINIYRIKKQCKDIIKEKEEKKEQTIKDIISLSDHLYSEDE